MAIFGDVELTNAGKRLLAKAMTGQTLKFTKGYSGSGKLEEGQSIAELTHLITPIRKMEITNMNVPPDIGVAEITLLMTNEGLEKGFLLREIGLFAEDPETKEEILYCYCNAGDYGDPIPGQDSPNPVYYGFNISVFIEQVKDVKAIFSENPLNVTYIQLNKSLDEVYLYMRKKINSLQRQIDTLSGLIIKNSIRHLAK